MRPVWLMLLACAFVVGFTFGQKNAPSRAEQEKLLFLLATVDFGTIYADDGAGDGTVTYKGQLMESGPTVKPDPRVKAVVDLKRSAIPLLIEHLDDVRPTRIPFGDKPTPLGHVALDILTHIVKPTKHVFFLDCADDGLGACFQPGFYFRPDASLIEMRTAKSNWQKLYARGAVQFEYPKWWR